MPANTLYPSGKSQELIVPVEMRPPLGGALCLDFANTVGVHRQQPEFDYLSPGYANILAWCRHADLLDDRRVDMLLRAARRDPRSAAQVRKRAVALRSAIVSTVHALQGSTAADSQSLNTLNDEYLEAQQHGAFITEGGRLIFQAEESKDLGQVLWPVARSAVTFLSDVPISRVRECAAEDCEWLFLDTSKNGSRRFCNASTCGTATRVRRFRQRQRQEDGTR
jgi:predicted RNA-binding Zn ribbon-like protein